MKARRSETSVKRIAYHQGERTVYVESLDDFWSVRYAESAKSAVRRELSNSGRVREIANQRLFIVELTDEAQRDELLESLRRLLDDGSIEFFTPVLRDPASDLRQILTDEISVRFKEVPSDKQLEAVEKKYGVRVARRNEFVPSQFVVKAPPSSGLDTLEIASRLDAADEVEFAAPNFISEHRR
jgi:hypothetical protein